MPDPETALPDAAQRRRARLLISFAVMATGLGQTVVFAILGPLGREVMLSEMQIGIIITCSSLVFPFSVPSGAGAAIMRGASPP